MATVEMTGVHVSTVQISDEAWERYRKQVIENTIHDLRKWTERRREAERHEHAAAKYLQYLTSTLGNPTGR